MLSSIEPTDVLSPFFAYLHKRMVTAIEDGEVTLAQTVLHSPPSCLGNQNLSGYGNAYRFLDQDQLILKEMCKGFDFDNDEAIATALIRCVLVKMAFKTELYKELFLEQDKLEGDLVTFSTRLETSLKKKKKARTDINKKVYSFYGNRRGHGQAQGDQNVIDWSKRWYVQVQDVVQKLKPAKSWKEATTIIKNINGIGKYIGHSTLYALLYGAMAGDFDKGTVFDDGQSVKASINTFVEFGEGPKIALRKLGLPQALSGIQHLLSIHEERLDPLNFPYIEEPNGSKCLLTLFDIEHALCDFSKLPEPLQVSMPLLVEPMEPIEPELVDVKRIDGNIIKMYYDGTPIQNFTSEVDHDGHIIEILKEVQSNVGESSTATSRFVYGRPTPSGCLEVTTTKWLIKGPLPKNSFKLWQSRSEWRCLTFKNTNGNSYFIYQPNSTGVIPDGIEQGRTIVNGTVPIFARRFIGKKKNKKIKRSSDINWRYLC